MAKQMHPDVPSSDSPPIPEWAGKLWYISRVAALQAKPLRTETTPVDKWPVTQTLEQAQHLVNFFASLAIITPCPKCRAHLDEDLAGAPFTLAHAVDPNLAFAWVNALKQKIDDRVAAERAAAKAGHPAPAHTTVANPTGETQAGAVLHPAVAPERRVRPSIARRALRAQGAQPFPASPVASGVAAAPVPTTSRLPPAGQARGAGIASQRSSLARPYAHSSIAFPETSLPGPAIPASVRTSGAVDGGPEIAGIPASAGPSTILHSSASAPTAAGRAAISRALHSVGRLNTSAASMPTRHITAVPASAPQAAPSRPARPFGSTGASASGRLARSSGLGGPSLTASARVHTLASLAALSALRTTAANRVGGGRRCNCAGKRR